MQIKNENVLDLFEIEEFKNPIEGVWEYIGGASDVNRVSRKMEELASRVNFRGECPNWAWQVELDNVIFVAKDKGGGEFTITNYGTQLPPI